MDIIITFTTGALRGAKNRDEILSFIKEKTTLDFKVLHPDDEAKWSLLSAMISLEKKDTDNKIVIMVDQGGGSTEISAGYFSQDGVELIGSDSLSLGSSALLNKCIGKMPNSSLWDVYSYLRKYVSYFLENNYIILKNKELSLDSIENKVIACAGSSVKKIIDIPSKKLHGTKLTLCEIERRISEKFRDNEKFSKLSLIEYNNRRNNSTNKKINEYDSILSVITGMPIILGILNIYNEESLIINGTGLQYGLAFAAGYGLLNVINEE